MKKLLTLLALAIFSANILPAQTSNIPQLVNFQAVARTDNGDIVANAPILVELTIRQGGPNGTAVYCAQHIQNTNEYGSFSIQLNKNINALQCNGAQNTNFENIPWESGDMWLQIKFTPTIGAQPVDLGAIQLSSVFYAFVARKAESVRGISIAGAGQNQVLKYNATTMQFEPGNVSGSGPTYVAGPGITISPNDIISANDISPTNEIQAISLSGNTLNLSLGGGSVTLPSATDAQTLSIAGNQLAISNGNTVTLPAEVDGSITNELQTLSLNGNQLSLSNGGGSVTLTTGTDAQTLSLAGAQLSILNGNTVTLPDASPVNEIQTLSLGGNVLSLSNGGGSVTLPLGTDAQTLSVAGNQLSISNGNTVTLPTGTTYTAGSGISIAGNQINALDVSPTNEIQTLSLNGNQLSIIGGNTVTLPTGTTYQAGNGITINGNTINSTWTQSGLNILNNNAGNVGIGSPTLLDHKLTLESPLDVFRASNTGAGAADYVAIRGRSRPLDYYGIGGLFEGGWKGLVAAVAATGSDFYTGVDAAVTGVGSLGFATGVRGGAFTDGVNVGVEASAFGSGVNYGVYSSAGDGVDNFAGYFDGRLRADRLEINNASESLKCLLGQSTTTPFGFMNTYGDNSTLNFVVGTVNGSNGNVGWAGVYNANGEDRVRMTIIPASGNGSLGLYGNNASTNVLLSASSGTGGENRGYMAVADATSTYQAGAYVDANSNGVLFADIKNFRMDHPTQKDKEIWYACVEGPEAAAYMRGTGQLVNGEAFIPFPEHFQLVINPTSLTIITTPGSADTYGLAVVEKKSDGFKVKELKGGTGTFSFDWEAKAVRKGFENYQAVRPKGEAEPMRGSDESETAPASAQKRETPLKKPAVDPKKR